MRTDGRAGPLCFVFISCTLRSQHAVRQVGVAISLWAKYKECSRTNRNRNVEFSRRRRQRDPFQVCSVVLGVGADQPSGIFLQVTYRGCMATSVQHDLQGVSSSDASPVICSAVEALAWALVWRLGLCKPHRDRVELSSRRNYCVIKFFCLRFTGDGQNNGNSCEIYTFLY